MAQDDVLLHLGAAQVEITVLEAHLLIHVDIVLDVEGRRLRLVEDAQLRADDFHLARLDVRVDGLLAARAHLATHGDAELIAQGLRLVERPLVHRRLVKNDLNKAGTVAHIDEDESAVVAPSRHPAAEDDLRPYVCLAKRAAMMVALHAL